MDKKIIAAREAGKAVAAETLRDARLRCGLNQREFARLAGVTYQYVSAVEHGKAVPSARVWARIETVIADHGAHIATRPEEAALLGLYRHLSPEGRRALETTAAALVAAEKK